MITVHKTEIARQNNSQYFLRPTPQKNKLLSTNHVFRGAHVLLRGAPSSPVVRTLLTRTAILTSFCV